MITPEERQGIINEAVEKALLLLPETVGNLITDHVAMSKINSQFYKDHPEFKGKKDIVASVIEKVDGENPLLDYKDVLGKAVPEIQKRIETVGSLDMETVPPNPSRAYEALSVPKIEDQHGKL
jgi:hypothetical protein